MAVAAVVATMGGAAAAPFVNRDVIATRVFTHYMFKARADRRYFLRAIAGSGDPVMHVWNVSTGTQVTMSDDFPGLGFNARVDFHPTVDGEDLVVLVRSFAAASSGEAKIMICEVPDLILEGSDPNRCEEPAESPSHFKNWLTIESKARFAGTRMPADLARTNLVPGLEYATAMVNPGLGGSDDVMFLALDAAGDLVRCDDDSGVGRMASLRMWTAFPPASTPLHTLIVGAYTNEGRVDVYANDAYMLPTAVLEHDRDRDSVGALLERAIGTCDSELGGPFSLPYCNGRELGRRADSDRDGLLDYEEIFGIDDVDAPQQLPAWGASPLRKDVFIQQDWALRVPCTKTITSNCWHPAVKENPFTEAMAADLRDALAEGSRAELGNIVGSGVGVHVDVGHACTDVHLCGDWGFGGRRRSYNGLDWDIDKGEYLTYVPEVRRHTGDPFDPAGGALHGARFRYFVAIPEGGQAKGTRFEAGINGAAKPALHHARTAIHELGHSLGSPGGHGGHANNTDVNCKPTYASIMNYAFNEHVFGFSKGTNGSLDPGMVRERNALTTTAVHLDESSTFTSFAFPGAFIDGSVDFNRSRGPAIFEGPLGFVRAGVMHALSGGCGAARAVHSEVTVGPLNSLAARTPAVAIFRGRIWVFWVEGNKIKYSSDAHTGANAAGSCAGGTGTLGETNCNDWCSLGGCPGVVNEVPLSTTTPIDGVSALAWEEERPNGGHLVLAYSTGSRAFVRTTSGTDGTTLLWPAVSAGAEPAAISNLLPSTELELSYMYVDSARFPDRFPSDVVLALFVVEQNPKSALGFGRHVWYYTTHPEVAGPSNWFRREVLASVSATKPGGGGAPGPAVAFPIAGRRAAGVTVWPNKAGAGPHRSDVGFACGLFGVPVNSPDDQRDQPRLLCYRKLDDSWVGDALPPDLRLSGRRPSIAFHTLRAAGQGVTPPLGDTFAGDPTRGQFWMTVVLSNKPDASESFPYFLITREVRADIPPDVTGSPGLRTVRADAVWDDRTETRLQTGVTLRETLDLSALKGATLLTIKDDADAQIAGAMGWDVASGLDRIKFLPFADGTFHASLEDANDFRVFDRGICLVLHDRDMSFEGVPCGFKNGAGY